MLTATFRSMVAHKLRLLLTTASIALGVALLAGTLVLTNTMGARLRPALRQDRLGHRRGRPHRGAVHRDRGCRHHPRPDRRVGPRRRPLRRRRPRRRGLGPGLRAADRQRRPGHHHQRWRPDQRLQHAGRRGAPRRRRAALAVRRPTNAHEVAIDATSAEENDIALGSTIKVLFQGPTQEFTVVGTVGYGDGDQGPRRHHVGVLRHRRPRRRCSARRASSTPIDVSAEDGRLARPSSPSGCRPWFPRAPRPSPARPSPTRTPTRPRRTSRSSASSSVPSPASRSSSAPSSSGTRSR